MLGFGLVFCLGGGLERYASPNDGEAETTASPTSEEPAENRGLRPFSGQLTLAHLQQAALHILGVVLRVRPVSRI